MKFSENTIKVLQSFLTINPGIHFKKGNILTSVHPQRVIMGQATIADSIPQDFVIHNLGSFLGVISLLNDPDLDFKKDKVVIKQGNTSVNYGFADPSSVKGPPDTEIKLQPDVSFALTAEELESIRNASKVMGLEYMKIEGDGSNINVIAYDPKDPSSHSYNITTKTKTDRQFNFVFKVADLQIVPGSYEVDVSITSKNKAGHFQCKEQPIQYWVALQADSKLI
jgi:hypothetical protein